MGSWQCALGHIAMLLTSATQPTTYSVIVVILRHMFDVVQVVLQGSSTAAPIWSTATQQVVLSAEAENFFKNADLSCNDISKLTLVQKKIEASDEDNLVHCCWSLQRKYWNVRTPRVLTLALWYLIKIQLLSNNHIATKRQGIQEKYRFNSDVVPNNFDFVHNHVRTNCISPILLS